ncbi:MAG: DNA repair protein RadA [Deltaproteobacteria bacterium]|nr:DNA repair protein RadA [Deltaproteobacteria bacterium]
MPARREEHVCGECGASTARWMGRCPACGGWGTLSAVVPGAGGAGGGPQGAEAPAMVRAAELAAEAPVERLATGFGELDRVLGGGLVPGSAVLLGGEPGVGKSTLLLQAADRLAATVPVLYVGAEESIGQVGRRARRLGVSAAELRLAAETELGRVLAAASRAAPRVLAVDSVQAVRDGTLPSAAGSVAQVRRVADALVEASRRGGWATLLVGHVTKDGLLAGPKTLEHLVDVVLAFEGDERSGRRVVRCVKNRYGAVDEVGVFEMTGAGLADAQDPSATLLGSRVRGVAGSAIAAAREGRRTLLVEVQALTAGSALAAPRRNVVGVDAGRTQLICAVLERWGGIELGGSDVYVAATGGLRVSDPGADLAVAAAIASGHLRVAAAIETAWMGEIGLCGELREVAGIEGRMAEAARMGLGRCVVPAAGRGARTSRGEGIEVVEAERVADALAALRECCAKRNVAATNNFLDTDPGADV